jgi:drug/metabolite transporter (DMT)-like permease
MTTPPAGDSGRSMIGRLADQPYLLLSLTALFWAGNAIVGRAAVGSFPPVSLSVARWVGAFLIVLPFAWRHFAGDWPAIRRQIGLMLILSATGIAAFNTLQYTALEYTTAINLLLLQSSGPLFVAMWSLLLFGVRPTLAQALGVLVSMTGVIVILTRGDLAALAGIELNFGDLIFTGALVIFGLYTVLMPRRPAIHATSFLAFIFGCGALCLLPVLAWELSSRPVPSVTAANFASFAYVAVFPSVLAYLCYNRGVRAIGANRAAPFIHFTPLFGSVLAIVFLGERPQMYHAVGYAMVLAGVIVAARKPAAAVEGVPGG